MDVPVQNQNRSKSQTGTKSKKRLTSKKQAHIRKTERATEAALSNFFTGLQFDSRTKSGSRAALRLRLDHLFNELFEDVFVSAEFGFDECAFLEVRFAIFVGRHLGFVENAERNGVAPLVGFFD